MNILKSMLLKEKFIYRIIYEGLKCDTHVNLVKKFMPRGIKSRSHIKTDWNKLTNKYAKEFGYSHCLTKSTIILKTSEHLYDFQKLMCSRNYIKLNGIQFQDVH